MLDSPAAAIELTARSLTDASSLPHDVQPHRIAHRFEDPLERKVLEVGKGVVAHGANIKKTISQYVYKQKVSYGV
jgi:hypothetical protein